MKKKIKIKRYSLSSLISETDLFFDWYLKYVYKDKQLNKIKNILKKELIAIYKKFISKTITLLIETFMPLILCYKKTN